ncbi:MAG: hypothetical protein K2J82_09590 [Muribaculaceae bacterium]|nr:hypothetical protein [Muribaculaceae bacterium]MDE6754846.1 hypothetical protein [Muribaculaceae bacterium]
MRLKFNLFLMIVMILFICPKGMADDTTQVSVILYTSGQDDPDDKSYNRCSIHKNTLDNLLPFLYNQIKNKA